MNMKTTTMLFAAVALLPACGRMVEERKAPSSGTVVAPALVDYPSPGRQMLTNNKLFLWREGVTPSQAQIVINRGRELDVFEEMSYEIRAAANRQGSPEMRDQYLADHEAELSDMDLQAEMAYLDIYGNTDFFTVQPSTVILAAEGGQLSVSLRGWEGQSYSSDGGDDPAQRVRDITYDSRGGHWEFKVYDGPSNFGAGDYYEFKISRIRGDVTDGRIFYQGDMNLWRNGALVRRGNAKIYSRSN